MTKTMKNHLSGALAAPSRRAALAFTGAALLTLIATPVFAAKGGKDKPGGGGEDPPPNPAPVVYQLTWIPGINGRALQIYDCNTAGTAVGRYVDETGMWQPFWTTADGVINPLDNWWTLPPGYEDWHLVGQRGVQTMQINEANIVCGSIVNDQTSEHQLFLANLADPDSLEPVGRVLSSRMYWVYMNERGDVVFNDIGGGRATLHLYVRSLDKMFSWEQEPRFFLPTGINDNLQISAATEDYIFPSTGPSIRGSALLTFTYDEEDNEGEFLIDDLGIAETYVDPMTLPWGGLNNDGTVFGYFETEVSRVRLQGGDLVTRRADSTAGFITAGGSWTELNASLPIGGSLSSSTRYDAAACVLDVNESGQVLGGYESVGFISEDLWLLDPEDGLFDVKDLVVSDPTEVEAFRAANGFKFARITEIDSETGYGAW